jgi:hypothetical protein
MGFRFLGSCLRSGNLAGCTCKAEPGAMSSPEIKGKNNLRAVTVDAL